MKLSDFTMRIMRKNTTNATDIPLTISSKEGLINQNDFFNKQVASKDMSGYYLLHRGEYAYNKSYSVGYDFGSIKRLEKYDMGALSTLYICFALTKFNSDFIKHYFDSLKWYREIYMISAEGARNHGLLNVPTEDFFATLHTLPTDEAEQAKIASFLDALTARIEKQRSLVENLKKYKRGLLYTIFSNDNNWDRVRLGDICSIKTGKLDANAMEDNGAYPFFTCAREHYAINTYAFDCDALLVSGNGANVGYIHHYCGKFNAYQRTYVLSNFSANIVYIQYYLEARLAERIEAEKKAGNTPYIVLSTLTDMEIPLPTLKQQNKIASLTSYCDKHIQNEERQLEYLEILKKSLLQKLFI